MSLRTDETLPRMLNCDPADLRTLEGRLIIAGTGYRYSVQGIVLRKFVSRKHVKFRCSLLDNKEER